LINHDPPVMVTMVGIVSTPPTDKALRGFLDTVGFLLFWPGDMNDDLGTKNLVLAADGEMWVVR